MKYYVHYVKNSRPLLKSFSSKEKADRFIKRFKVNVNDGDWIDFSFKGKIEFVDEYYKEQT